MLQAFSDFISKVTRGETIVIGNKKARWQKVSELTAGAMIAVPKDEALRHPGGGGSSKAVKTPRGWPAYKDSPGVEESGSGLAETDVLWDEIVSIKRLSPEQVYDIEVEGTHNFIAGYLIDVPSPDTKQLINDEPLRGPPSNVSDIYLQPTTNNQQLTTKSWFGGIFAHNTYLNGNVGVGTSSPGYKLDVQGGYVNSSSGLCIAGDCRANWASIGGASGWTDDGTVVRLTTTSDNVGIGTTSPGAKLDVSGTIKKQNKFWGTKSVSVAGTWTTVLTITMPGNHTAADVNVQYGGYDWCGHSAPNYRAQYSVRSGAGGYGDPGSIIYEYNSIGSGNDFFEAQLVNAGSQVFYVQMKANDAGDGFPCGAPPAENLEYEIDGYFSSII